MPFAPAEPLPAPAAPFDNAGFVGRWVIGFVPDDQALGAEAFLWGSKALAKVVEVRGGGVEDECDTAKEREARRWRLSEQ